MLSDEALLNVEHRPCLGGAGVRFSPEVQPRKVELRRIPQQVYDEALEAMDGPRAVLSVDAFAHAFCGPDPRWVHVLAREDEVFEAV
jgi:hypothetical protein